MVFDNLLDIIKHTYNLGFIDLVKVTGDENGATIEAMESNRAVVLSGKLNKPITGLHGTVGLSRIGILNGYLNFDQFAASGADIKIVTEERNGATVPTEINFKSAKGHTANYRFMAEQMANEQIVVPTFKGASWEVVVAPEKSALKDLAVINNILGSYESAFTAKTVNGNLEFHIGAGTNDRTKLVFASGVTGELRHAWNYPLSHVLSIMKLHDTAKSTAMCFSDKGALKISVDSGMGSYEYIIPARTN